MRVVRPGDGLAPPGDIDQASLVLHDDGQGTKLDRSSHESKGPHHLSPTKAEVTMTKTARGSLEETALPSQHGM